MIEPSVKSAPIMRNAGQYARGQNPRMACPHCGGDVSIYYGVQLTRTYREVYYQCKDIYCGCTFKAALEVVQILSPSGKPNPHLRLPTKIKPVPPEPYEGEVCSELEEGTPHQTDPPATVHSRKDMTEPASLDLPF